MKQWQKINEQWILKENESKNVIYNIKTKDLIILNDTSFRMFIKQLESIFPLIEGTGNKELRLEIIDRDTLGMMVDSGYKVHKNMTISIDFI